MHFCIRLRLDPALTACFPSLRVCVCVRCRCSFWPSGWREHGSLVPRWHPLRRHCLFYRARRIRCRGYVVSATFISLYLFHIISLFLSVFYSLKIINLCKYILYCNWFVTTGATASFKETEILCFAFWYFFSWSDVNSFPRARR